tara:strand:+ start:2555 stop:2974 length:420 start_codon:yes stop_codon:yes gene_type:complete
MSIKFFNAGEYEPRIGTSGSAGIDLYVNSVSDSNGFWTIGTGIHVEIPQGWVGLLIPRSSWGSGGWSLCNTIGVIDSDYRGEIIIKAERAAHKKFDRVSVGDCIVQLVVTRYNNVLQPVHSLSELSSTERDSNGFGSTN